MQKGHEDLMFVAASETIVSTAELNRLGRLEQLVRDIGPARMSVLLSTNYIGPPIGEVMDVTLTIRPAPEKRDAVLAMIDAIKQITEGNL